MYVFHPTPNRKYFPLYYWFLVVWLRCAMVWFASSFFCLGFVDLLELMGISFPHHAFLYLLEHT